MLNMLYKLCFPDTLFIRKDIATLKYSHNGQSHYFYLPIHCNVRSVAVNLINKNSEQIIYVVPPNNLPLYPLHNTAYCYEYKDRYFYSQNELDNILAEENEEIDFSEVEQ
jgi:hypothetical protein